MLETPARLVVDYFGSLSNVGPNTWVENRWNSFYRHLLTHIEDIFFFRILVREFIGLARSCVSLGQQCKRLLTHVEGICLDDVSFGIPWTS